MDPPVADGSMTEPPMAAPANGANDMRSEKLWRWALVGALVVIGSGLWRATVPMASAQGGAAARMDCCVGVVRLNDVLNKLTEKAVREDELKRFFEEREGAVNQILASLQAVESELKLMPKDAPDRRMKLEERARLGAKADAEAKIAQAVAEDRKKRMELELFGKIRDAVREIAQRKGLAVVLSDDSDIDIPETASYREVQMGLVTRRLMYSNQSVDISSEVATFLNNQFKAQ